MEAVGHLGIWALRVLTVSPPGKLVRSRLTSLPLTLGVTNLLCSRASDYGLMKIDDKGRVLYFNEKPKGAELKNMVQYDQNPKKLFLLSSFPSSSYWIR